MCYNFNILYRVQFSFKFSEFLKKINSAYIDNQTMKIYKLSIVYVMIENVDEIMLFSECTDSKLEIYVRAAKSTIYMCSKLRCTSSKWPK